MGVGRGKGGGEGRIGRGGRGVSGGRSSSSRESRALVEKVKTSAANGSWEEALAHVAEARSSGLKLDGRWAVGWSKRGRRGGRRGEGSS